MAASTAMLADFERLVPGGISTNVPLNEISRWKIGGNADVIIRPQSPEQVKALRQYFHQRGIHHIVIGMTSNLLFADEGLRVPCIQIDNRMGKVTIDNGIVTAEAGAWVPGLARKIQQAGLTGAEHICGIPGTIGGLICMNGGSQRKGIGSAVIKVTSIDETGVEHVRTAEECQFAYRQSIFQCNNEIIVKTALKFSNAENPSAIKNEMLKILADRRRKFPRKQPNCGSVFKSDPAMYSEIGPPGQAIEKLGFKGYRIGDAMVSPDHANFIVNAGDARADDVLLLIAEISKAVQHAYSQKIHAEACYISPNGTVSAADTVKVN